ncbi:hypothetical protein KP509_29G081400 [Ceratopteris richardii]|uniref:NADH dehydrogenase [ubiquinone] 1 alpha subcomplex subunit 1 n=1 Tax=Ceratopteris richardii TaxID=49495 RepID=A0A8T2RAY5_CERRI|nr:hypothetical protein KP509_29G081400 [Ceratopteris richardii]
MWWESVIPMGIIVGMIFVMGESQAFFHKLAHGKPKHPCNDAWDRAMEERDYRVRAEAAAASKQES